MPITQVEKMPMLRVFFSKTGRAKYTSHLDTMRMFTRALRRSALPLWYTQGFNPHLYMTFALPIPLGYEGLCESVDLRLTEDVPFPQVTGRIQAVLPPGFSVVRTAEPVHKPDDIVWADYRIHLPCTHPVELFDKITTFYGHQPAIEVSKRTKKGAKMIDIKPLTVVLRGKTDREGMLELELRCAAGIHLNIAPTLFLDAFFSVFSGPEGSVRIVREAVLLANGRPFE